MLAAPLHLGCCMYTQRWAHAKARHAAGVFERVWLPWQHCYATGLAWGTSVSVGLLALVLL